MSLEQDVAAARRAVEEVEGACDPLTRYPGDAVDAGRLTVDPARVRNDLTPLCGAAAARGVRGVPTSPGGSWDDGYDDGVARSGRTVR
jgi:hypothetical protein